MSETMPRLMPPGVEHWRDRHGQMRYYYRASRSAKRVPLKGDPRTPEFVDEYLSAVKGAPVSVPRSRGAAEVGPERSITALAFSYYQSQAYRDLRDSTKIQRRRVIDKFVAIHGSKRVDRMERQHLVAILDKISANHPEAANNLLKALRLLMGRAIELGWIQFDPTAKIKKNEGDHWRSWTDDEIAAFEKRWPIGTSERLAFALQHYTGQRRSDVVRMTRADIEAGRIRIEQQKTGGKVSLPLHPELAEVIRGSQLGRMFAIESSHKRPRSAASYGNWMADAIKAAGLPDECKTHGLRKAAGRRLAEAGATAHQIMSILGLATLAMAELYTRDAERARMADQGMDVWQTGRIGNAFAQT